MYKHWVGAYELSQKAPRTWFVNHKDNPLGILKS
jgi:hypothetical protein